MKALILFALLAVLAVGGYIGYTTLADAPYGIDGSAPLGSFEALDVRLTEDIGLVKSPKSVLPVRDIATTERMFRYTNPENPYESITLLLDESDALRGVVGVYWLGDYGSRSPVMLASQAYWRRVGGPRRPKFTERQDGGLTVRQASFETDGASGTWREWTEEGQRQVAIHVRPR